VTGALGVYAIRDAGGWDQVIDYDVASIEEAIELVSKMTKHEWEEALLDPTIESSIFGMQEEEPDGEWYEWENAAGQNICEAAKPALDELIRREPLNGVYH
jgi:hypothetical protein